MIPHSDRARRRPFLNDPGTATVTVVARQEPNLSHLVRRLNVLRRLRSIERTSRSMHGLHVSSIDRALTTSVARATTDGRCALSVKSRTPVGYLKFGVLLEVTSWHPQFGLQTPSLMRLALRPRYDR